MQLALSWLFLYALCRGPLFLSRFCHRVCPNSTRTRCFNVLYCTDSLLLDTEHRTWHERSLARTQCVRKGAVPPEPNPLPSRQHWQFITGLRNRMIAGRGATQVTNLVSQGSLRASPRLPSLVGNLALGQVRSILEPGFASLNELCRTPRGSCHTQGARPTQKQGSTWALAYAKGVALLLSWHRGCGRERPHRHVGGLRNRFRFRRAPIDELVITRPRPPRLVLPFIKRRPLPLVQRSEWRGQVGRLIPLADATRRRLLVVPLRHHPLSRPRL